MYSFYLGDFKLPITPSSLTVKVNNKNETVTLMNDSEVNILKDAGLDDYSFDFVIPQSIYPFVDANVLKPASYYLSMMRLYKGDKKVIDFIVIRTKGDKVLFNTSTKVSIEDYTVNEDAEDGFDLTFSVSLKQYKSFGTKVISLNTTSNKATEEKQRETTKETPKTYTVKKGDTLSTICKKMTGDGSRAKYTEIAKLNNISNPNFILPGQVIKFS